MPRAFPVALATVAVLVPASVRAQSTPPPASPPPAAKPAAKAASGPVDTVVVTGKAAISTAIDRRSYSIAGDLKATTGSVADALRNVPSVEVDVQGNVSLRGDPSVTILIDGRPAPQFQGPNRGDALQALPAGSVDRIEVMTNPSAEFTSQGTGGIINIVTKGTQGAPPTLTVRAAVGTAGRSQLGINAGATVGAASFAADASFRDDPRDFGLVSDSVGALPGQAPLASHYENVTKGRGDSTNAGVRMDYQLDPKTRLSAQARVNVLGLSNLGTAVSLSGSSPSSLTPAYDRTLDRSLRYDNRTVGAGLRRTFTGEQHEFTFDYQHLDYPRRDASRTTELGPHAPTTPAYADIATSFPLNQDTYKLVYRRPMPLSARLVVGYDRTVNDLHSESIGLRGSSPATVSPDPLLADRYHEQETQQSFYGTYQQPFGKLTVLGGLRIETLDVAVHPLGLTVPPIRETDVDPTLNLAYKLSDTSKLTFGYSRRIERPFAVDYNPALIYNDPLSFHQGNPNIHSAKTDSFETAYERRKDGGTFLATFYYRHNWDVLTYIAKPLPGGAIVTQRANALESRNGGLELVADGPLFGKFRYNMSGNAYYSELIGANGAGNRSGTVLTGRANINWSPNDTDLFQLNLVAYGRFIAPQGYVDPRYGVNVGYRRKLAEGLFMTVTGEDVVGGLSRYRLAINSPTLTQTAQTRFNGPAAILGLSYAFGGAPNRKKAPPTLEYGGGAAGP